MRPCAFLKPRHDAPFRHRHPWVFSGSVGRVEGSPEDGAEVDLRDADGAFVARGLYNGRGQIRVRLYTWDPDQALDAAFFRGRLERAIRFRRDQIGLVTPGTACRLVFSEGDGLSGLVVDRYDDWLVVQLTSLAMAVRAELLLDILDELMAPRGVYLRTERGIGSQEGLELSDHLARGAEPPDRVEIREHGLGFLVDLRIGHKTGCYLDQRDNRLAAAAFAGGRRCLDVCCYTGGFALNMAAAGAREVLGIDASTRALEIAAENARRNGQDRIGWRAGDALAVLPELAEAGERFDLIVLDPPRFAQSRKGLAQALRGYAFLNEAAVRLLSPDGVLVTCSCSGRVSRDDFRRTLGSAAAATGRDLQIFAATGAGPDHPVSAACPESDYLKCFFCRVP